MISEALYALLDAAVDCEVCPWPGPDNTYPLVTYQRDSEFRGESFDGTGCLVSAEFDVSCWSASYTETQQLAKQIRDAMTDFEGLVSGVRFHRVRLKNQIDLYDEEVKQHRAMLQLYVAYSEV